MEYIPGEGEEEEAPLPREGWLPLVITPTESSTEYSAPLSTEALETLRALLATCDTAGAARGARIGEEFELGHFAEGAARAAASGRGAARWSAELTVLSEALAGAQRRLEAQAAELCIWHDGAPVRPPPYSVQRTGDGGGPAGGGGSPPQRRAVRAARIRLADASERLLHMQTQAGGLQAEVAGLEGRLRELAEMQRTEAARAEVAAAAAVEAEAKAVADAAAQAEAEAAAAEKARAAAALEAEAMAAKAAAEAKAAEEARVARAAAAAKAAEAAAAAKASEEARLAVAEAKAKADEEARVAADQQKFAEAEEARLKALEERRGALEVHLRVLADAIEEMDRPAAMRARAKLRDAKFAVVKHEASLASLKARETAAVADGHALREEEVQLLEDAQHPAKPDLSEEPSKEERDAMLKWEETQECIAGNIEESKQTLTLPLTPNAGVHRR